MFHTLYMGVINHYLFESVENESVCYKPISNKVGTRRKIRTRFERYDYQSKNTIDPDFQFSQD